MDIVPYVISWQSAAAIGLALTLSVGGGAIAISSMSRRRRRMGAGSLMVGGVLLAAFSSALLLGMYAPGGASVYEARKIVLGLCVGLSAASIVLAVRLWRAARELE
jgi:hypothetical protein